MSGCSLGSLPQEKTDLGTGLSVAESPEELFVTHLNGIAAIFEVVSPAAACKV